MNELRFVAAPDDWPLGSSRDWWAIYDSRGGKVLVNGHWRTGRKRAEKVAAQLNRGFIATGVADPGGL